MEGFRGRERMRFGRASPAEWGRVRHLLIKAIEWSGDWTESMVIAALATGSAQLWIGEDDAVRCGVVTCLSRTARGLVCEIWLMGGEDRHRWLHFLETIEAAARAHGCVAIELIGRRGWARLLPEYRTKAILLRKVL